MRTLRFVLGDQLDRRVAALQDLAPGDVVLGAEVRAEATYVRHHKQKIAFLFSAMRHFFAEIEADGALVDYRRLGRHETFAEALEAAVREHRPDLVVVTEPGEWRVLADMRGWEARVGVPVEIRDDDRFFADHSDFARFAEGRRELRMETFYRDMRRSTGTLMDEDGNPVGERWNYDHDNRKALPKDVVMPRRPRYEADAITREVIGLVEAEFGDHFGTLDAFNWPVTRADALAALDEFLAACLPRFGDFQDAMAVGEPQLFHSLLSPLMNCGLLRPREVVARAEAAWRDGAAPLNAVEGFIRQILGWREFIRGVYWLKMPDYRETNTLAARRPLPQFYWDGETDMRCMAETIRATRDNAYAHHIQRLMVTGNFALLAGIRPAEIEEWYLIVYADAYDWVELPNVHGMATFADGGLFASKPYAASGAYIDRMSDYCRHCAYDVKAKTGDEACPFNYLYWNFLIEHRERLSQNRRIGMIYKSLERMPEERRRAIVASARRFLEEVAPMEREGAVPGLARSPVRTDPLGSHGGECGGRVVPAAGAPARR
ncbi:cryptochrome/photolyase family protein [Acuticoccus sp.]|uniref:cryptochrome/photolyase family protein n=1 Tax=Acuticoccus sp. TaxID=1904378 RepID=UPI003B5235B3